jgi:hypothetical protein
MSLPPQGRVFALAVFLPEETLTLADPCCISAFPKQGESTAFPYLSHLKLYATDCLQALDDMFLQSLIPSVTGHIVLLII